MGTQSFQNLQLFQVKVGNTIDLPVSYKLINYKLKNKLSMCSDSNNICLCVHTFSFKMLDC